MAPRNSRELTLKLAALACIAVLLGDRLVLTPMIRAWDVRTRRLRDLELTVGKGKALLAQEQHWRDRWAEEQRKLLPAGASEAEGTVVQALHRWARESGLRLTSVRPRGNQDVTRSQSLEIQAAATGSMGALARFLYAVETAPMALAVEDLELSAGKQGGENLTASFRLTGLVLTDRGGTPETGGT
jgi:Tfp pilus assembly protein PilO